jgi:hypothetical protein
VSARKRPGTPASGRGQALAELRRSGAAGTHGKRRPDRHNTERRAIAAELRAS